MGLCAGHFQLITCHWWAHRITGNKKGTMGVQRGAGGPVVDTLNESYVMGHKWEERGRWDTMGCKRGYCYRYITFVYHWLYFSR